MAPLVLGPVNTFLLRLLQFNWMSCLLWIYLSKEVEFISIDQSELKLHIKIVFSQIPTFMFLNKIQGVENLYVKWPNFWLWKKSYFFSLNLYCTCSKLSFDVYNSHVSKIFNFDIFLHENFYFSPWGFDNQIGQNYSS